MTLEAALKLAIPEQGIDLIEIAPTAVPPVVRLMNYDKYRYQAEKAAKKERLAQKTAGLKQVQISARAATHDLEVKLKKLEEFLAEDYHVEISMRLKGREKYNKPWALQKLDGFLKMIKTEIRVESSPKFGGRGVQMQIMKKK
jgi:translation initiation factor IF-3